MQFIIICLRLALQVEAGQREGIGGVDERKGLQGVH